MPITGVRVSCERFIRSRCGGALPFAIFMLLSF